MQINDVGKIYLVGDLHFGVDANSIAWLNHQKKFFSELLIPHLKKTVKPGYILFQFGDIFETKQTLNVNIFNNVMDLFEEVAEILPVYIFLGNHDTYYSDRNDINSLKILSDKNNVHLFENPTVIGINKKKLLVLPWISDFNNLMNILEDNQNKANYVFAHMDVAGMTYDNGYPIQRGVDFDILSKYDKVFSGHIHKPQVKDNFIYIGTPYHLDFGDVGQVKGFYELNPNTGKYKFIQKDKSPTFNYVDIFELLEMNDAEIKNELENCFVKVKGPNSVLQSIQKDDIKTHVKSLLDQLHKFDFDPIPDKHTKDVKILKFNLNIPELAKENLTESGKFSPEQVKDIVNLFKKLYDKSLEKMKKTDG